MRVERVDPRDTRWEVNTPSYRVYFWRQQTRGAYESDEYSVSEADVREVLGWADHMAGGDRTYVIYALVHSNSRGPGLVRLAGIDPMAQPLPGNLAP